MHQSTTPSLSQTIWPRWASRQFLSLPIVHTLLPVTFGYSLSSEAIVMRQLRWKRLSLAHSHKRTSMGPSRSCWNGTSALQLKEITSKRTRVSCVLLIKVPIRKSLETYLMILIYIYIYIYIYIHSLFLLQQWHVLSIMIVVINGIGTLVQILEKAVGTSLPTKALGKGMNHSTWHQL